MLFLNRLKLLIDWNYYSVRWSALSLFVTVYKSSISYLISHVSWQQKCKWKAENKIICWKINNKLNCVFLTKVMDQHQLNVKLLYDKNDVIKAQWYGISPDIYKSLYAGRIKLLQVSLPTPYLWSEDIWTEK